MDRFQEFAQDFKDVLNSVQKKFSNSASDEEDGNTSEASTSASTTPVAPKKPFVPKPPPPPPVAPPGAPEKVDVLVVGGGLSGLTAAYHLTKHNSNLSVVVLEAKERLGGRVWTQQMKAATGKDFFDLGRTWINSKQARINSLIKELEIEVYQPPDAGQNIMEIDGRIQRYENSCWPLPFFSNDNKIMIKQARINSLIKELEIEVYQPPDAGQNIMEIDGRIQRYENSCWPLPFFSKFDISSFISKVENMRNVVPIDDPTKCQHAWDWDKITFEQFRADELYTDAAINAVDTLVMLEFGVTSREISLLYVLHYLNCCGGWSYLLCEKEGRARDVKIMGGSQTLCEVLANKIKRRKIRLREQVVEIDQRDKEQTLVTTKTGEEYTAKKVVVATSAREADKIEFLPTLPPMKISLLQRMPTGTMYKAVVTYAEPFWTKKGFSGQIIRIINTEQAHKKKPNDYVHAVYDATTWNKNPALEVYYTGLLRPEVLPEDRQESILNSLKNLYNCVEALEPLDFIEVDWSDEPFCSGYPTSILMPGGLTYYYEALLDPLHRIHWAGSALATTWKGHMEGSVESGCRAAVEVLSSLHGKANGKTTVANGGSS
ncbi:amine oxidase [flavin-containing] A-like [Anneissia japonica]|uniref:amine oxidase [flavin-containing] A-like n=1 Tax=Anneissia japonica TaxID=1529436 RepID=UPI0014258903|nr:amine oxidase [flavin-containing] A-like [Anneissia japonica]